MFICLIVLLLNNCVEKEKTKQSNQYDTKNIVVNTQFGQFIDKFESLSLPFKGDLESRNFVKFFNFSDTDQKAISKVKIPYDDAKKYFFAGVDSLISKSQGGRFEFFYGYKLPTNGNYFLLFYNRYSNLTSFDYRLATFDLDGILIDDIGIGGGVNNGGSMDIDVQREFLINEDYTINIEEVNINNSITSIKDTNDKYLYDITRKDIVYTISNKGTFDIKSEKSLGVLPYYYDEEKTKYISKNSNSLFR